jgi:hypothetical protein
MRLDPELCPNAGDDWRGALAAPRGTERFRIAQLVVENARALSNEISTQPDVDHRDWMPGSAALERLLDRRRTPELAQLSPEYMIGRLCEHVKRIAIAQPMVVQVPAPAKVFGDIHGQLRDLLMLFCRYGFPSHHGGDIETTSYVFNGDWVDRGAHQLEVVVLLLLFVGVPASLLSLDPDAARDRGEGGRERPLLGHASSGRENLEALDAGGAFSERRPRMFKTLSLREPPLADLHRRQVELLKEWRSGGAQGTLEELLLVTNAIAGGLRTTG